MEKPSQKIMHLIAIISFFFSVGAGRPHRTKPPKDKTPRQSRVKTPNQATMDFRQIAKQIPLDMMSNGVTKVGSIELSNFLKEIDEINVLVIPGVFVGVGSRNSITNRFGTKEVIAGQIGLTQIPKGAAEEIVLHEAFGALGYQDADYELTSTFKIKKEMPNLELAIEETLDTEKGGATGVSGGGDGTSVELKSKFLEMIVVAHENDLLDSLFPLEVWPLERILEFIILLKIEPLDFRPGSLFSSTSEVNGLPNPGHYYQLEEVDGRMHMTLNPFAYDTSKDIYNAIILLIAELTLSGKINRIDWHYSPD